MPFLSIITIFIKSLKLLPILAVIGILGFGGFKIYSYVNEASAAKEEVKVAGAAVAVLKETNQENVITIQNQAKTADVNLNTVVKQTQDEKVISIAVSKRELDVKKKLADVINTYEASAKDAANVAEKDVSISTIQINSIWGAYCEGTPSNSQCKGLS